MFLKLRNRTVVRNRALPTTYSNQQVEVETNTMANDGTVVKHEIITSNVNIPKFCGDPKVINVDAWLSLIDNHIANKGVVGDSIKIEVLKQHVNPSAGEARHVIKLGHLREVQTYEEYKKTFKSHFKGRDELEPLRALISFLTLNQDPQESTVAYIARLEARIDDWIRLIKDSDWKKDQDSMLTSQVGKMLAISKIMAGLDKVTAERLHKDIKTTSKVGDIACYLRRYGDMPRALDTCVLPIQRGKRSPTPSRGARGRSLSRSRAQSSVECYKCHKLGHLARGCRTRLKCNNCQYNGHMERDCRNESWCEYHKSTGHTTRNCRAKNSKSKTNFQGNTDTTAPT